MANDDDDKRKRKKKRGRRKPPKLINNLASCFPSFDHNNPDLITVTPCNNEVDSSRKRRLSTLFKALFFDSFLVKKKVNRSSSKSSATSDTTETSSSLSSEKTMKSLHPNNSIRVRESTDMDSGLLSSCSRTTSSSNLSSSCCSSSNSNSQWSSEQKSTSARMELVEFKPNPVPISSINSTSRSDSLPKPNKQISSRTLVSSNSLPLPKPTHDNHNQNKIKSSTNNRNNVLWCLFLLLSLVVLVVYGRIYSILCTSTWFYFVPCRSRKMKRVNSVNAVKVVDTDSEQYKKRVIIAGLLDRTRNPIR